MEKTQDSAQSFRLSTGGLFYQIFVRLGIQDSDGYSVKRRITLLIVICWIPLLILAAIDGNLLNSNLTLPFLHDFKPYVRYLLVLPLLIIADTIIDPLIATNIRSIGSSGILGDENKESYTRAVERLTRRKDSILADIVILVIVIATSVTYLANLDDLDIFTDFTNWIIIPGTDEPAVTYAGWWFLLISAPVLQIILYRWFWRFYLWAEFLYHVSRMKLKLQPTHPDLAGGLGILRNGENAFILIFIAFGAMFSVGLAEEILYTDIALSDTQPVIIGYITSVLILVTLPMLFFTPQLIKAKRWGRVAYGGLGYRLSRAFDQKWANPDDQSNGDELLKTADSSAVCDYADIYGVVKEMRFLPISMRGYVIQAFILVVPFFPLVFTEVPVADVFSRIMEAVM